MELPGRHLEKLVSIILHYKLFYILLFIILDGFYRLHRPAFLIYSGKANRVVRFLLQAASAADIFAIGCQIL